MNRLPTIVLWALTCCLASCATSKSAATRTPTQEELDALIAAQQSSLGEPPKPAERVSLKVWRFEGPPPQNYGSVPTAPANELERRFAEAPNGDHYGEVTEAAHCVARELGRFIAQEGKMPSVALSAYLQEWCGGVDSFAPTWVRLKDGAADPARLFDSLSRRFKAGVAGAEVGAWFDDSGFGLAVQSTRELDVDPVPMVVDDSHVVSIHGRVRPEQVARFEAVNALITTGPYTTERCNADPTVKYPEFSLQCFVKEHTAHISIQASLTDSDLIGVGLATALAFTGEAPMSYRAPPVPAVDTANDEVVPAILRTINAMRSDAGLDPMQLSRAQSETIGRARPVFDTAFGADDFAVADKVVAGMIAGWQVDGDIIDTHWSIQTLRLTDVRDILAYVWEGASSRDVLFSPDARWVAIHWDDAGRLSMFAYDALPDEHYNRRVGRVFNRINELRQGYGRHKVHRIAKLNSEIKEICDAVSAGKITMEQGSRRISDLGYKGAAGRWWTSYRVVSDLDNLSVNPQLLRRENLDIGIGVAVARAPGSAFSRYVVYFFWED